MASEEYFLEYSPILPHLLSYIHKDLGPCGSKDKVKLFRAP